MVKLTISIPILTTSVSKFLAYKNPTKILSKILDNVALSAAGIFNTLKCLVNLYVNTFLPPPGGAEQTKYVVSLTLFNINSLRS